MRIVDSSPRYKLPVTIKASIKVYTNARKHQTWKSPWYSWTRPVSQSCCNHCKRGLITLSIWFLRRSDWKIQNSLIFYQASLILLHSSQQLCICKKYHQKRFPFLVQYHLVPTKPSKLSKTKQRSHKVFIHVFCAIDMACSTNMVTNLPT